MSVMILLDADFNGNSRTIRLKYYDKGKPLVRIIDDYYPYLLEKGSKIKKFNPITLKNDMYDKITFETPSELNDFHGSEGGYEHMWYHRSYLSDKQIIPGAVYKDGKLLDVKLPKEYLGKFDKPTELFLEYSKLLFQPVPDFRMLAIDIKVEVEVAERPDLEDPLNPIRLITAVDKEDRYCWTFDCNIDDARRFDTETEMLENFMEFIQDYPIILSFNGDDYDFLYLKRRGTTLGLDLPIIEDKKGTKLEHGSHLDILKFFRLKNIRMYAFPDRYRELDLNELSKAFLGETYTNPDFTKKLTVDELYELSMRHSDLTFRLTQFDDQVVMRIIILMMRITKTTFYDITRSGVSRWIYVWLVYEHRRHNYLIPNPEEILSRGDIQSVSKTGKYAGGLILDTVPGVFGKVTVLDFASHYPSIIKAKNLFYETMNCPHEECETNKVPELGHWICTKYQGIISILFGLIRDIRINWFKSKDIVVNLSLKVLINAGYGVIGSDRFVFYCPPMAESTTALANDLILRVLDFVESLGLRVLYGHTDSFFIESTTDEQLAKIMKWTSDEGFDLEVEHYLRFIMLTELKNNYFAVTNTGMVIIKGLSGKKSNTPRIIRDAFDKIVDLLSEVVEKEDMVRTIPEIKKVLVELSRRIEEREYMIEDVMISSYIRKSPTEYKTWAANLQVVAQLVNAGQSLNDFKVGVRLDYVKVEEVVKVLIPGGLKIKKGPPKQSKFRPVNMASVDEVDLDDLIEKSKNVFKQLLEPLKIAM